MLQKRRPKKVLFPNMCSVLLFGLKDNCWNLPKYNCYLVESSFRGFKKERQRVFVDLRNDGHSVVYLDGEEYLNFFKTGKGGKFKAFLGVHLVCKYVPFGCLVPQLFMEFRSLLY
ncbi:hypothetical protein L1049_004702 [Liquidambar formosana]|uniref:Uncharacterized protein n=1 Tax=Liquidambar formosana TaxID=63359 RepID=A0AAP0RNW9_LIQFO